MVDNVKTHAPDGWDISQLVITQDLPAIIDEVDPFIPEKPPEADLLISLGEHPGVAQMIPDIVMRSNAKAVIAPADNRVWLPAGLARQVQQKLQKKGIDMVYPVPFCLLSEKDSENEYIKEFARYFGIPVVDIEIDDDIVSRVTVKKEAPCGSTRYVAQNLPDTRLSEAVEQSGLQHHQYPCLATMVMDKEFEDTLMHRAGLALKLAVEKSLKEEKKKQKV
jgi:thymidylate synthase